MLITPSFKKSLIVEQFQGNYLKVIKSNIVVSILQKQYALYIELYKSCFSSDTLTEKLQQQQILWNSRKYVDSEEIRVPDGIWTHDPPWSSRML